MPQTNLKSPRIDWRGWVLPIAFIALWFIATQQHWVNTRLIVPPLGVLTTGWQELQQPSFYEGVALSLWRDLSGFAIGAIAGVALGTLIGV